MFFIDILTWDFIQNIFQVAGGLGLFLYGMKMMSDGLENMAGDRMSAILKRATSNRFLGVLIGIIVTCVIQSSTASTVMVVGFVNAGFMTFAQSVGVIMGINVGTSISTQIISFKIDQIAPLFIFIGLLLHLIFKKRKVKNFGFILLGFGILFLGFSVMGAPLKELAASEGFQSMLTTFQNPILALIAGIIFTAIIQSSTATIGIIIALYLGGTDMPFHIAAFLVLGSNIGTCFTAILASIPASRESKRVALVHMLFSIIGCIIFGTLIALFPGALAWIQNIWPDGARQVAMFHTIFNVSTAVMLIAFTKQLTILVEKIIPVSPNENDNIKRLIYFEPGTIQIPEVSIMQAHRETCRMGNIADNNIKLALEAFYTKDLEKATAVLENEKTINFLNGEITSWVAHIRSLDLSGPDLEKTEILLHALSDIERVGDYAENIAEYTLLEEKYDTKISTDAVEKLKNLSEAVIAFNTLALDIFAKHDKTRLPEIDSLKITIDDLSKECIKNHMQRLEDKTCDPRGGMVFTDIVIDLTHCIRHSRNIAYSVSREKAWWRGLT